MTLDEIGLKYHTDKASSHHDYLKTYERYLGPVRDRQLNLLEIGVQFGFSVEMWAEYLPNAKIYGVDIHKDYEPKDSRISLTIGNQADPAFWTGFLADKAKPFFDVIIDDASHNINHQLASICALWEWLKPSGIYVLEDVFTWWDRHFNPGGHDGALNFILGSINHFGTNYHGKPHPPVKDHVPTVLEPTLSRIYCHYGLVILQKAAQ